MQRTPHLFAVAVLFLFVQYASILHAAEHPFHEDAPSCDVFISVDKSKAGLDTASSYMFGYVIGGLLITEPRSLPLARQVTAYLSRAPPVTLT